ncbi:hypothetical protein GCM10011273_16910 [Asticcacaulis endophyticus]|uniref:Uncharacterized protein n=1 Tax=Asticcacaulis endophyticus TaxID=1395890 RepID=A0A918URZ8_9CAUL|nr:hypothetical protein GCM10011273_16910 [Asticcacaulis endophyticus]
MRASAHGAVQKGITVIDLDRQLPTTGGIHLAPDGYPTLSDLSGNSEDDSYSRHRG